MEKSQLGKRKRSEQRKGLRKDTKSRTSPLNCPICDVTVRPQSLIQHYEQELAKVDQLQPYSAHSHRKEPRPSTSSSTMEDGAEGGGGVLDYTKKMLESVQRRRFLYEQRLRDQRYCLPQRSQSESNASQAATDSGSGELCPVCDIQLPSDGSRVAHIEACLEEQRRRLVEDGVSALSSHSLDMEDGSSGSEEEYEEYTWCNTTRIRATSLLSPQARASMFNASVIVHPSDTSFEETVDVEEDSSTVYGPAQFSEGDILSVSKNEETPESELSERLPKSEGVATTSTEQSVDKIVPQCLICMDHYEKPVVSVLCWHVYCEQCWLKALKAQKLCPKCKTITCSSDLRRIFL